MNKRRKKELRELYKLIWEEKLAAENMEYYKKRI